LVCTVTRCPSSRRALARGGLLERAGGHGQRVDGGRQLAGRLELGPFVHRDLALQLRAPRGVPRERAGGDSDRGEHGGADEGEVQGAGHPSCWIR
jgi:hypothetical protein